MSDLREALEIGRFYAGLHMQEATKIKAFSQAKKCEEDIKRIDTALAAQPEVVEAVAYPEGEAPWTEDEQFEERAKACKARCKQYGYTCGKGGEEDYEEGACAECDYDAQNTLRKKYAPPAPPLAPDARMRKALEISIRELERARDYNNAPNSVTITRLKESLSGAPDASNASAEAIELAYGLLWVVGCDRSTKNGNALYLARKALYEQIDKAGQARGITAAKSALSPAGADEGKESEGGRPDLFIKGWITDQYAKGYRTLPSGPSDPTPPARVDYRKFMEWVGLSGPRPTNAELAFYLEIELANREEVDAVEAAVLREAIEVLKDSDPTTPDAPAQREAIARIIGSFPTHPHDGDEQYVLHDAFPGDYDSRTAKVYELTDAVILALQTRAGG